MSENKKEDSAPTVASKDNAKKPQIMFLADPKGPQADASAYSKQSSKKSLSHVENFLLPASSAAGAAAKSSKVVSEPAAAIKKSQVRGSQDTVKQAVKSKVAV